MAVSKQPLTKGAKAQFFNPERGRFEKVLVKEIKAEEGTIIIQKRDRTGRPNGKAFEVPASLVARAKADLIGTAEILLAEAITAARAEMAELSKKMQEARKRAKGGRSAQRMLARLTK